MSLQASKRHFKQQVLPRRVLEPCDRSGAPNDNAAARFRKVEAWEPVGQLYPVLSTGLKALAEFGLGIGLYFRQLLYFSALCFVCGCVLIPLMLHYADSDFGEGRAAVPWAPVCDGADVVVADCGGGEACEANYRGHCKLSRAVYSDLAMSGLLILFCVLSRLVNYATLEVIDMSVQSTQDYSLCVHNPPPDAADAKEWHEYFSRWGEVRAISICRSNWEFVKVLVRLQQLRRQVELRGENKPLAWWQRLLGQVELNEQLQQCEKAVELATHKRYPVTKVFVLYEYEQQQRLALQSLNVGKLFSDANRYTGRPNRRFQNVVLDVREADEPDDVLWHSLQYSDEYRFLQQLLSLALTGVLLWAVYIFITFVSRSSVAAFTPLFMGALDTCMLQLVKLATSVEKHPSQGQLQRSLFSKVFCAKIFLSTVITVINTDWSSYLESDAATSIRLNMLGSFLTAPAIKLLDLPNVFQRNVLARFAKSQHEMNRRWQGTNWNLAERYTDTLKVMLTCIFYSFIVPESMFLSSVVCMIIFCVDRYLLLRKWRPVPRLGAQLSALSRIYIVLGVVAHMGFSTLLLSTWPMDEVVRHVDHTTGITSFEQIDKHPEAKINFVESWMTGTQKELASVYSICLWVVIIYAAIDLVVYPAAKLAYYFLSGGYSEMGESTNIGFSTTHDNVHIPHVWDPDVAEDFVCADVIGVPEKHDIQSKHLYNESNNLADMVGTGYRSHCLSIVRWFSGQSPGGNVTAPPLPASSKHSKRAVVPLADELF